jgi:hypothetical protein
MLEPARFASASAIGKEDPTRIERANTREMGTGQNREDGEGRDKLRHAPSPSIFITLSVSSHLYHSEKDAVVK